MVLVSIKWKSFNRFFFQVHSQIGFLSVAYRDVLNWLVRCRRDVNTGVNLNPAKFYGPGALFSKVPVT